MGITDVTELVERNDLRDRFGHEREPPASARVKDHRFIVNNEVQANIEATGDGVDSQRSIDAIDSRCNLVDCCSGVRIRLHQIPP